MTFHDTLLQSSFTENEDFYIKLSSLQHLIFFINAQVNLRYQTGTYRDAGIRDPDVLNP